MVDASPEEDHELAQKTITIVKNMKILMDERKRSDQTRNYVIISTNPTPSELKYQSITHKQSHTQDKKVDIQITRTYISKNNLSKTQNRGNFTES